MKRFSYIFSFLISFLFALNVNALSVDSYTVDINGYSLTTQPMYLSGNVSLLWHVNAPVVHFLTQEEAGGMDYIDFYLRLAVCSTVTFNDISNQSNSNDIRVENTSFSCSRNGINAGKVIYFYTKTSAMEDQPFNVYWRSWLANDGWFQLIGVSIQLDPFTNQDYGTSTIIDQNGTIIDQNKYIQNQNDTMIDQNNKLIDSNTRIENSLNNSDTSQATNDASSFFSGFETDTFGLTSIITSPLNLIGSITNGSCSQLGLPLPFVDKMLYLPCLGTIYSNYFGDFLTIYQLITFGIVAYWVCVRIFALVKDFKNPDHDEIEVLEL